MKTIEEMIGEALVGLTFFDSIGVGEGFSFNNTFHIRIHDVRISKSCINNVIALPDLQVRYYCYFKDCDIVTTDR